METYAYEVKILVNNDNDNDVNTFIKTFIENTTGEEAEETQGAQEAEETPEAQGNEDAPAEPVAEGAQEAEETPEAQGNEEGAQGNEEVPAPGAKQGGYRLFGGSVSTNKQDVVKQLYLNLLAVVEICVRTLLENPSSVNNSTELGITLTNDMVLLSKTYSNTKSQYLQSIEREIQGFTRDQKIRLIDKVFIIINAIMKQYASVINDHLSEIHNNPNLQTASYAINVAPYVNSLFGKLGIVTQTNAKDKDLTKSLMNILTRFYDKKSKILTLSNSLQEKSNDVTTVYPQLLNEIASLPSIFKLDNDTKMISNDLYKLLEELDNILVTNVNKLHPHVRSDGSTGANITNNITIPFYDLNDDDTTNLQQKLNGLKDTVGIGVDGLQKLYENYGDIASKMMQQLNEHKDMRDKLSEQQNSGSPTALNTLLRSLKISNNNRDMEYLIALKLQEFENIQKLQRKMMEKQSNDKDDQEDRNPAFSKQEENLQKASARLTAAFLAFNTSLYRIFEIAMNIVNIYGKIEEDDEFTKTYIDDFDKQIKEYNDIIKALDKNVQLIKEQAEVVVKLSSFLKNETEHQHALVVLHDIDERYNSVTNKSFPPIKTIEQFKEKFSGLKTELEEETKFSVEEAIEILNNRIKELYRNIGNNNIVKHYYSDEFKNLYKTIQWKTDENPFQNRDIYPHEWTDADYSCDKLENASDTQKDLCKIHFLLWNITNELVKIPSLRVRSYMNSKESPIEVSMNGGRGGGIIIGTIDVNQASFVFLAFLCFSLAYAGSEKSMKIGLIPANDVFFLSVFATNYVILMAIVALSGGVNVKSFILHVGVLVTLLAMLYTAKSIGMVASIDIIAIASWLLSLWYSIMTI